MQLEFRSGSLLHLRSETETMMLAAIIMTKAKFAQTMSVAESDSSRQPGTPKQGSLSYRTSRSTKYEPSLLVFDTEDACWVAAVSRYETASKAMYPTVFVHLMLR